MMSMTLLSSITFLLLVSVCSVLSDPPNETACQNVQDKLQGLKVAVAALCGGETIATPTIRNTWTSVPLTSIGGTNMRHASTFSYVIPSVIPSTAKNILVYAAIHCGHANAGTSQHIKIFTQDGSNKRYEKYLYVLSWNQSANNTNSDNMWFPMPSNRRIYMTVTKDNGTYCGAYLFAIGYN